MSDDLKADYAAFQEFAQSISIVQGLEMRQGSAAWLSARVGRATGSRIDDVMSFNQPSAAKAKELGYKLVRDAVAAGVVGEPTAARYNYMIELVAERLSGVAEEHYVSPEMLYGSETEPLARAAYEFANDCEVDLVGFAVHPTIPMFGSSPDGLVGTDGLVEFKCPKRTTHLKWMAAGVIPPEYVSQMTAELACMPSRKWNDFMSYCPTLPEQYQLFQVRLERDEAAILRMESRVFAFLCEVQEFIDRLQSGKTTLKQQLEASL